MAFTFPHFGVRAHQRGQLRVGARSRARRRERVGPMPPTAMPGRAEISP
ncbi:hypothetical protein ACU635_25105 [[Actinomadura] parvosata]